MPPSRSSPAAPEVAAGLVERRCRSRATACPHPQEYEGGALSVRLAGQQVELPRAQGSLAVWPGWTLHQVAPITEGERWVLAVFGYGPPLR